MTDNLKEDTNKEIVWGIRSQEEMSKGQEKLIRMLQISAAERNINIDDVLEAISGERDMVKQYELLNSAMRKITGSTIKRKL
jgi:hypothetical protein